MTYRWLGRLVPRDADQQEAAGTPVSIDDLQRGDLITYGDDEKATHIDFWVWRRPDPPAPPNALTSTDRRGGRAARSFRSAAPADPPQEAPFGGSEQTATAGKTSVRIIDPRARTGDLRPAVAVPTEDFHYGKPIEGEFARSPLLLLVLLLPSSPGAAEAARSRLPALRAAGNAGKTYPQLRVVWDAPDYMDPWLYYTGRGLPAHDYVWTGFARLQARVRPRWRHSGAVPGESMPKVSADEKNYKFTLRPNLKYSDGIAREGERLPVHDRAAISRSTHRVGFYSDIKGVMRAQRVRNDQESHISGISHGDDAARTIENQLDQPRGDLPYILALEFSSFVPAERRRATSRRIRFRQLVPTSSRATSPTGASRGQESELQQPESRRCPRDPTR